MAHELNLNFEKITVMIKDCQTLFFFYTENQKENILGFLGHVVSVTFLLFSLKRCKYVKAILNSLAIKHWLLARFVPLFADLCKIIKQSK